MNIKDTNYTGSTLLSIVLWTLGCAMIAVSIFGVGMVSTTTETVDTIAFALYIFGAFTGGVLILTISEVVDMQRERTLLARETFLNTLKKA